MSAWGQRGHGPWHRIEGVNFGVQRVACGAEVNVTGTYHVDPSSPDGRPAIGVACAACANLRLYTHAVVDTNAERA